MSLGLSRLSYLQIGTIADEFLTKNNPADILPVPIEEIAESQLGLTIVPVSRLKSDYDVDASLDSKLTTVFIDYDLYSDRRYENRSRFTLAHEIGHLVLHSSIFSSFTINSPEDLLLISKLISEEDYKWLELQAFMFAGHVLVPSKALLSAIHLKLPDSISRRVKPEEIYPYSQELIEMFRVSGEVLSRRLDKLGIIDHDGL